MLRHALLLCQCHEKVHVLHYNILSLRMQFLVRPFTASEVVLLNSRSLYNAKIAVWICNEYAALDFGVWPCAMMWPDTEGQIKKLCTGHKRQEQIICFMPVLFMYLYENLEISYCIDCALCLASVVTCPHGAALWLLGASGDCLARSLEMEIYGMLDNVIV
jgi:hypothetical protein